MNAGTDTVCWWAKPMIFHVSAALASRWKKTPSNIAKSIAHLVGPRTRALFGCRRISFDGYRAKPRLRPDRYQGRLMTRARAWNLCFATPMAAHHASRGRGASRARSSRRHSGDRLGIHTHNDTEKCWSPVRGAAVECRCAEIQGTLNGLG